MLMQPTKIHVGQSTQLSCPPTFKVLLEDNHVYGLCEIEKIPKNEITMEVEGWVQASQNKNWKIVPKYSYTSTDILG